MQADAHGPDYPRLGSATSETSADLRDIEEPCTTALALDPPRILPGDCADAWRSVRTPLIVVQFIQLLPADSKINSLVE